MKPGDVVKLGTRVEVRNRFDGAWSTGFVLEEEQVDDNGRARWRKVRRASDGMVLPEEFAALDVRKERTRGNSTWWY